MSRADTPDQTDQSWPQTGAFATESTELGTCRHTAAPALENRILDPAGWRRVARAIGTSSEGPRPTFRGCGSVLGSWKQLRLLSDRHYSFIRTISVIKETSTRLAAPRGYGSGRSGF